MYDMFGSASSFNLPLNRWDFSSVTNVEQMLHMPSRTGKAYSGVILSSISFPRTVGQSLPAFILKCSIPCPTPAAAALQAM